MTDVLMDWVFFKVWHEFRKCIDFIIHYFLQGNNKFANENRKIIGFKRKDLLDSLLHEKKYTFKINLSKYITIT